MKTRFPIMILLAVSGAVVPPVDVPAAPGSGAADLAVWLSLMATGVDTMLTLDRWLALHPQAVVTDSAPPGMSHDVFCRSAVEPARSAARTWSAAAVFVIPDPPAGEALPHSGARIRVIGDSFKSGRSVSTFRSPRVI